MNNVIQMYLLNEINDMSDNTEVYLIICETLHGGLGLWCLMPPSTIFRLYRDDLFD